MVRTSVFNWWTFPDLRLPIFGWRDHFVGQVTAIGSTNQANTAFRLFRVGKWVVIHIIIWITRPLNSRPGLRVALWLQDQSHVCVAHTAYTLHATLCVTQSAAAAAVCSLWCHIGEGPFAFAFYENSLLWARDCFLFLNSIQTRRPHCRSVESVISSRARSTSKCRFLRPSFSATSKTISAFKVNRRRIYNMFCQCQCHFI